MWLTQWDSSPDATLGFLPSGDPAAGNLTTVAMCVSRLYDGRLALSETCFTADVEVLPQPGGESMFSPEVLLNALASEVYRLEATIVGAIQLADGSDTNGVAEALLGAVVGMLSQQDVSAAELSGSMFAIEQVAGLGTSGGADVDRMADMTGALVAAAGALSAAAGGDPAKLLALAEEVVGALLATLDMGAGLVAERPADGGESSPNPDILRDVNQVIDAVGSAATDALASGTDAQLGSNELSMLLYRGDGSIMGREYGLTEPAPDADDPCGGGPAQAASQPSDRRRRLLQSTATGARSLSSRRGGADLTIEDFVGPDCENDCSPQHVSLRVAYVADSSYLLLGVGTAEFRRGLAATGYPARPEDRVHTVSGVLSLHGNSGALVPAVAVQLPLDMQHGLSDLASNNKYCARLDYDTMEMVFIGHAETVTLAAQTPRGFCITSHFAVCWADRYGDYVILQVSSSPEAAAAAAAARPDYIQSRHTIAGTASRAMTFSDLAPPPITYSALSTPAPATISPAVAAGSTAAALAAVAVAAFLGWQYGGAASCLSALPVVVRRLSRLPVFFDEEREECRTKGGAQEHSSRSVSGGLSAATSLALEEMNSLRASAFALSLCRRASSQVTLEPTPLGPYPPLRQPAEADTIGAAAPRDGAWPQLSAAWSTLHLAAATGNLHALQAAHSAQSPLLAAQDAAGRSPLHIAAGAGQLAAVRLLLSAGPDAFSPQSAFDAAGASPLHLAAIAGHARVVEVLLAQSKQPVWRMTALDDEGGDCADADLGTRSSGMSHGGSSSVTGVLPPASCHASQVRFCLSCTN